MLHTMPGRPILLWCWETDPLPARKVAELTPPLTSLLLKQEWSLPKLSFCFKLCSFLGLQWKWTCLLFCTFTKAKADSWKITAAPCDFTTRNALIFPASVILKLTSRHKNWCLHALVRFTNHFRLFAANIPCFATGRGRLGHKSWWLRRRKSCLS